MCQSISSKNEPHGSVAISQACPCRLRVEIFSCIIAECVSMTTMQDSCNLTYKTEISLAYPFSFRKPHYFSRSDFEINNN